MQSPELKLKQASAVLQVPPKELQNLVQFGVVRPKRRERTFVFDTATLLTAKIAFSLKDSLGAPTNVLAKLTKTFFGSLKQLMAQNPKYVVFTLRLSAQEDPVKVGVPLRALSEELKERLALADLYRDLPRGRKRRGWKKEFLQSLAEAAKDIGEISEEEILRTVREYRRERRAPKITVAAES